MDKSQLYSQIFIYVLSIILIAFILVYGYNAVQSFKDKACEIACIKMQNDLKNSIEGILSDFGTVKRHDIEMCCNYNKICFVESVDSPNLPNNVDPIIKDSVLSGAEKNVFLVDKIAERSFFAGKISVDPDVLCLKSATSRISLRLESRGNYVILSKYEE